MAEKVLCGDVPVYNILLLGESGVGKSMFVNSFVNYAQYDSFGEAQNHELKIIIPIQFEISDDDDRSFRVSQGEPSENECVEAGHSGTKWCKSYMISMGSYAIRLLDAPGVGSTVHHDEFKMDAHEDMTKQDQAIIEDILHFIASFDHLHAIAILVKANETRYTDRFNYCLKSLMNNLNRTAMNNLVFIVNFASDSNYAIQSSLLERFRVLTSNPNLTKDRMFPFDQKCVKYLLAEKKGAHYDDCEKLVADKAWSKSQESCARLLDLIVGNENAAGLVPYKVSDTLSINDARLFIRFVEPIIADLLSGIQKNEDMLQSYLSLYNKAKGQINDLEVKRLKYSIEIKVIKLETPMTLCNSQKCTRMYKAPDGTVSKYHMNVCCDSCQVTGPAWRRRLFCQMFRLKNGQCKKCKCHVNDHQRVYYKTEEVSHEDEHVANLLSAVDNEENIKKLIVYIGKRQETLRNEKILIESAINKFKDFLKTNPMFPDEMERGETDVVILPDEVYAIKQQLFNLKINGSSVRQAYDIAKKGVEKDEHRELEETIVFVKNCVQKFRDLSDNLKNKALMAIKS